MSRYAINRRRLRTGRDTTQAFREDGSLPLRHFIRVQANMGLTTRTGIPRNVAQASSVVVTNGDDSDGVWLLGTTGSSSGNATDFYDSTVYKRDWKTWGTWRIKTGSDVSSIRLKVGFVSGAMANSEYGGTLHAAYLSFSTVESYGSWRAITNDGSGSTGASSGDLAIKFAASTVYLVDVQLASTYVRFGINGRWLYRSTTKLPGSSTALIGMADLRTQTAATRAFRWAWSNYHMEL